MAMAMHAAFRGQGVAAHHRARPVGGAHGRHGDHVEDDLRPEPRLRESAAGRRTPSGWAEEPQALLVMIFADTWKTAPFMALLLLAGLQVIPGDIYEAAKVDGATAWQRFVRDHAAAADAGAAGGADLPHAGRAARVRPAEGADQRGATEPTTLSLLAQRTFQTNRLYGEGSALSILTFLIVMIISFLYIRLVGGNLHGDGGGLDMAATTVPAATADRARQAQASARPEGTRHALVAVDLRRRDRRLLPAAVLLAGQHQPQDRAGPVDREPVPAAPDAGRTTSRSSRTRTSRARWATARSWRSTTTVHRRDRGSFAAYALARLRMRGKFVILAIVLSITTFPQIAIAAPLFRLWTRHRPLQHAARA